jgi:hypothetical protein
MRPKSPRTRETLIDLPLSFPRRRESILNQSIESPSSRGGRINPRLALSLPSVNHIAKVAYI